ncbi:MAG: Mut7-C RNAse domain-containing protein [Anaerolineae bacterium]|nr:Mut7-C RNAse domain-containing protein [Anaerolineae bacterium]
MSESPPGEQEEPLRLLADGMLGRLAKWLRLLGYDTAYENDAPDHELARRARAEGRVLLTRDRELAARPGLRALLIQAETLEEQVREVQDALGPPPGTPLSRCPVCNGDLKPVAPSELVGQLPPYVLRTQRQFRRCPDCGRVYWRGTHIESMRRQMDRFFERMP